MKRHLACSAVATALLLVGRPPETMAQSQCAQLATSSVTAGQLVAHTDGYARVALGTIVGGGNRIAETSAILDAIPDSGWTPTNEQVAVIGNASPENRVLLYYKKGETTACWSSIMIESPDQSDLSRPAPQPNAAAQVVSCEGAAGALEARQRGSVRGGLTVLVFDNNGNLCDFNRDYGVVGDPIYVGIVTMKNVGWDPVQFQPCAIQPDGPRLYVGTGAFPGLGRETRRVEPDTLVVFGPRRCFNAAVDIVLKQHGEGAREQRFSLSQYQRYDATLQFGAIFSGRHDHSFTLRSDTGTVKRILDQGPTGNGVEYVATVVLYALPRKLLSVFPKRLVGSASDCEGAACARGRDLVHDNGLLDRIGGLLGASVSDPGRRFIAGVTFEVTTGLSALAAYEWVRVKSLHGVSVDSIFTGAASDIPTSDSWTGGWVWGLTLDLRYVTALFSRQ